MRFESHEDLADIKNEVFFVGFVFDRPLHRNFQSGSLKPNLVPPIAGLTEEESFRVTKKAFDWGPPPSLPPSRMQAVNQPTYKKQRLAVHRIAFPLFRCYLLAAVPKKVYAL